MAFLFNFLPASDNFCLPIAVTNSLYSDLARQNVGPDLDPNCFTQLWYFCVIFFEKANFEYKSVFIRISQHAYRVWIHMFEDTVLYNENC